MQVHEAMTEAVEMTSPDETIRDAARKMAAIDAGLLPVADHDRLVGMISDRDIAVRAVAAGLPPTTKVSDVMSTEVKYCFDDDDLEDVARNMAEIQVRRLPVMNRDKRLVGIIALSDIAMNDGMGSASVALAGISEPGGMHNQSRGTPRPM
jgi:CBS domain-containing protein